MVQPIDQGSILRSGASLVPDYANQMLQRQQMQMAQNEQNMQQQMFQAKQSADARKMQRENEYGTAIQKYMADPKPERLLDIMARFPEHQEGLNAAYTGMDKRQRESNLQQQAEIYGFARNGRLDLAAKKLRERITADEAAGVADDGDREILAGLESTDPVIQKQALGMIEMAVAAANPDKFNETFKTLNPVEAKSPFEREYEYRVQRFGQKAADSWRAVNDEKFVPVDGIGVFRGSDLLTGQPPETAVEAPTKGGGQVSGGSRASIYAITEGIESGGSPNAVSPKGARGPMQTMPYTLTDPGFGVQPARNNSVEEMRRVGRDYLDAMIGRYGGDMRKAWAAYNWGPGNLEKAIARYGNGWLSKAPLETRKYVAKAMSKLGKSRNTPVSKKVGGKTYYEIDGKWYDNPEGK